MASNKTPNLNMDVWAETDYFKRAELNSNFQKVDTKVKEHSDKIGVVTDFKATGTSIIEKTKDEFQKHGVNPVWFGADPTGVVDSSQAVIDALAFMKSNNLKKLQFPEVNGTFLINKPVLVSMDDVELDGGNNLFKISTYTRNGFAYTTLFFLGTTTGTFVKNIRMKRFRFDGFIGHTVRAKYVNTLKLSDLIFTNGSLESIFIGKSSNVDVNRVEIDGSNAHGMSFDSKEDNVDTTVSHWRVRNSVFKNCKWMAIDGHSAAGTIGRVENNTIVNCSQFTKNQAGKAVVIGNHFSQTDDFVSKTDVSEVDICYFNKDDLEFTNNTVILKGDRVNIKYLLRFYNQRADLTCYDVFRAKIKDNTLIDKTTVQSSGTGLHMIHINSYDNAYRIYDVEISSNYIESQNVTDRIVLLKNTNRTKVKDNTFIVTVTGTLVSPSNYYALSTSTFSKDLEVRSNIFIASGNLGTRPIRLINIDTTAEGVVKVDNNTIRADALTNGTVYHAQFIRGAGYKVFTNNVASGTGSIALGTDVVESGNYGATINKS